MSPSKNIHITITITDQINQNIWKWNTSGFARLGSRNLSNRSTPWSWPSWRPTGAKNGGIEWDSGDVCHFLERKHDLDCSFYNETTMQMRANGLTCWHQHFCQHLKHNVNHFITIKYRYYFTSSCRARGGFVGKQAVAPNKVCVTNKYVDLCIFLPSHAENVNRFYHQTQGFNRDRTGIRNRTGYELGIERDTHYIWYVNCENDDHKPINPYGVKTELVGDHQDNV